MLHDSIELANRERFAFVAAFGLLLLSGATTVPAQQYITDDAALTEYHACQLQMWHGERSSWLLPVCTPVRNLEVSLGLIAVWHDNENGHREYVVQAKTLFKPLEPDSWGAGFVLGGGGNFTSVGEDRFHSMYAYVTVGESIRHDRLILHENIGLVRGQSVRQADNAFTWAVRADAPLAGRVGHGLVGVLEIYGAERVYRDDAHTTTEYQAGLRTWIRPDRVQVDLTRGRTIWRPFGRSGGPGWTIGLTLVSAPFL